MSKSVSVLRDQLRKEKLREREQFSIEERTRRGALIIEQVLAFPAYQSAKHIGLFADIRGEVPTGGIFSAARESGKTISYPRVERETKTLRFYRVDDLFELMPGSYQIPEPSGQKIAQSPADFDLIFVPGVVFDPDGNRLGYGQGYYDRLLTPIKRKKNKVGVAFEFQIIPRIPIPKGAKDVRMDWIITERRSLKI